MATHPHLEPIVDHESTTESTVLSIRKGDPGKSGSEIKRHILDTVDKAEISRAIRKMDLTILPVMTMFYLLSFLVNLFHCILQRVFAHLNGCQDRTNIGKLSPNFDCVFLSLRNRRECKSRWAAEGSTYD